MERTAALKACRRTADCRCCPDREACPEPVRTAKTRSRQFRCTEEAMRRAAKILATGWFSASALGDAIYGQGETYSKRKSAEVRARRSVNRLRTLGLVTARLKPTTQCVPGTIAEYTLTPEGLEVMGC